MVVDIQGCYSTAGRPTYCFTDPQLHSTNGAYGEGDLRENGIKKFFKSHVCGPTCEALGITYDRAFPPDPESSSRSAASADRISSGAGSGGRGVVDGVRKSLVKHIVEPVKTLLGS